MAWKQLVATAVVGAGLSLGVGVPAWAQSPMMDATSDVTTVQQAVQKKLSQSTSGSDQIEVNVDPNGVVSLTGFVGSDAEKTLAVQAAQSIPGVTDVHEDLRVVPIYLP
jgi:osmotically-inducible protein OsmY